MKMMVDEIQKLGIERLEIISLEWDFWNQKFWNRKFGMFGIKSGNRKEIKFEPSLFSYTTAKLFHWRCFTRSMIARMVENSFGYMLIEIFSRVKMKSLRRRTCGTSNLSAIVCTSVAGRVCIGPKIAATPVRSRSQTARVGGEFKLQFD